MLTSHSFKITHTECGEETNEAAVGIDSDQLLVTVRGTITGNNGSMTGELERVAYDDEVEELLVTVGTTERSGDMFPQCVTEIDYEAEFQFQETLPARIMIQHRSLNRTHSVIDVSPG